MLKNNLIQKIPSIVEDISMPVKKEETFSEQYDRYEEEKKRRDLQEAFLQGLLYLLTGKKLNDIL